MKKKENIHLIVKSNQNMSKKRKITKNEKDNSANINNHYQKKEKLNKSQIEEIDCELVRAFICCSIPFWIIENPAMINLLKSLNANYDPPSRTRQTKDLLQNNMSNSYQYIYILLFINQIS